MKKKILFLDDIFSEAFRETLDSQALMWDDNWVKSVEEAFAESKEIVGVEFKLLMSGDIESSLAVIEDKKPDALLLDMFWSEQAKMLLGDSNKGEEVGLGALRKIRDANPELPIIVYTMKPNAALMTKAYEAGATFFSAKNSIALPDVQISIIYMLHYLLFRRN